MTAIVTTKFHIRAAKTFKDDFDLSYTDRNYYLFIARPREWDIEIAPPTPENTQLEELNAWHGIMALKRIVPNGVTHCIPRFDWDITGNTVYAQYSDDDPDLFNHPTPADVIIANGNYTPGAHWVITDQFHVFKCLFNNNMAFSTEKPLRPSNNVDVVETSDGYKWKYMFTVGAADALKFLTDAWIPVKVLDADDGSYQWQVQQGAEAGVLSEILVVNGGSGYSQVRPVAEGCDAATSNTITVTTAAQTQAGILPSPAIGDNYYTGCTVWIESGAGIGQSRVITAYDNTTRIATLDSAWTTIPTAGDDYTILPTVEISGDGTDARAKAFVDTVTPNDILSVLIVDAGTSYTYAAALVSGAGGSNAELQVIMPPLNGHGSNAIQELGARYIMLNSQLAYNEGTGDFPLSNDYRQIGLIADVLDFNTSNISTATTLRASTLLNISSVSGTFQPDEDITTVGGDPVAFLVDYDSVNGILAVIQDPITGNGDFTPVIGTQIIGSVSGATAILDSITDPEVEKMSGQILYIENRRPILRSPSQSEDIKIVIAF